MVISYSNFEEGIFNDVRDILRNSSEFRTLLGITDSEKYDTIFAFRPIDQKKGFDPPRVVVEAPTESPSNVGSNPDGFRDSPLIFVVNCWIKNRTFSDALNINSLIKSLLNNVDFTTDRGKGHYSVNSYNAVDDPDMDNTKLVSFVCQANILCKS